MSKKIDNKMLILNNELSQIHNCINERYKHKQKNNTYNTFNEQYETLKNKESDEIYKLYINQKKQEEENNKKNYELLKLYTKNKQTTLPDHTNMSPDELIELFNLLKETNKEETSEEETSEEETSEEETSEKESSEQSDDEKYTPYFSTTYSDTYKCVQ